MQSLKISIVTVTYNAGSTIRRCIESVIAQNYPNIDYIIIDGGSTDHTLQIINEYKQYISFFLSEPDQGIYDAMNKGISYAKGDIIGMLNADDVFADINILSNIAAAFNRQNTAIVYGNLNYVNLNGDVIRIWESGIYKYGLFNWGWMPPHPTFYCKKHLFEDYGLYDLKYGTAADYELMTRFMHLNKLDAYYLNQLIVTMTTGGISNRNIVNRLKAWSYDFKAMSKNGVSFPLIAIAFKPLRKIVQYIW